MPSAGSSRSNPCVSVGGGVITWVWWFIVFTWTCHLKRHSVGSSVILLCYRITCSRFCNKRSCDKKGRGLCQTQYRQSDGTGTSDETHRRGLEGRREQEFRKMRKQNLQKTSSVTEKPLRHCRIPVTPLLSWSPADWTQELETSWRQTDTGRSCPAGTQGRALTGLELSSHPRTGPATPWNSNCIPTQLGAWNCLMLQSYFRQRESTPTTSLKQTKEHQEAQWSIC